jgi:hypothetical protein
VNKFLLKLWEEIWIIEGHQQNLMVSTSLLVIATNAYDHKIMGSHGLIDSRRIHLIFFNCEQILNSNWKLDANALYVTSTYLHTYVYINVCVCVRGKFNGRLASFARRWQINAQSYVLMNFSNSSTVRSIPNCQHRSLHSGHSSYEFCCVLSLYNPGKA